MNRLTAYNFYKKDSGKNILFKIMYRIEVKLFSIISKYFPRKLEYDFHGGSQWINFTHNCVKKIFEYLKNDKKYIKRYLWVHCADEIFF